MEYIKGPFYQKHSSISNLLSQIAFRASYASKSLHKDNAAYWISTMNDCIKELNTLLEYETHDS